MDRPVVEIEECTHLRLDLVLPCPLLRFSQCLIATHDVITLFDFGGRDGVATAVRIVGHASVGARNLHLRDLFHV